MKKPALFVFAILLIALISIYFIIPQIITTTSVIKIDASDATVAKYLLSKKQWRKWWPGQHDVTDSTYFTYNDVDYHLQQSTNSSMPVTIKANGSELHGEVIYAAEGEILSAVSWITQKQTSLNPFTRINEYLNIKKQTKDIDTILRKFKAFMHVDSNVYGIKVSVTKIQNPMTLATKTISSAYPSADVIYELADKIRKQIKAQGGKEIGAPMLNINQTDDHEYQVMVALQTQTQLQPGNGTVVNNMVKGGNLLTTRVKGGRGSIDQALSQLKIYQKNHRLISPAIPFQVLTTNRLAQKDTANWITEIYWPIF